MARVSISPVTAWLQRVRPGVFSAWAGVAAFLCYYSMYAFRRPFSAALYGGDGGIAFDWEFGGAKRTLTVKSLFVLSQLLGYLLSKYLGSKFCAETHRERARWRLIGCILVAELALVMFGLFPQGWTWAKAATLLLNGIPLGLVWGLVVRYLEGRRTSEILLAVLSLSYILASGHVKAVGLSLQQALGLSDYWMPAATGLAFLPLFLFATWMLAQLPKPTVREAAERMDRGAMDGRARVRFLRTFLPGVLLLCVSYLLFTAFRDFRDNFQTDLLAEMGYDPASISARISWSETLVAAAVTCSLLIIYFIRDNRRGFIATFALMLTGLTLLGFGTLSFQLGWISGWTWTVLTGIGGYLAYVPFGSVLFDRLIAYTRFPGTAVFAIYLTDSVGYTGAFGITIWKDFFAVDTSRFSFFLGFTWLMTGVGLVSLIAALLYFLRQRLEPEADTRSQ